MTRPILPTLAVLAALAIPASALLAQVEKPASAAPTALDPEAVDAFLDDWVPGQMEKADIPGVAIAVVQAGRVLTTRGFGYADIAAERPVDPRTTVFRLGSISKPLTAATILATLENVDFDLDRDVRPLLTDLDLRPKWDAPLTLRQLLTQTGGFNENLFGQHVADPRRWLPLDEYLARRLPPRFAPPGEAIAYCDFHTSLAGLVAARLAGTGFEELAESRLLGPLGMTRTSFRQLDLPEPLLSDLAVAYGRKGDGLAPYPRDWLLTTPAAGVQSTALDMARYLIALTGDGAGAAGTVMSPGSWREQKRIQFRHHENLPGRGLGLTETRRKGRTFLSKDGQASGFHARFFVLPEAELAIFSVHNRSIIGAMGSFNAASRFHRSLGWKLVDTFLPELDAPPPTAPAAAAGAAARLAAYEGTYRTTVTSRHTAEKIISMMEDIPVRRADSGGLAIGSRTFVEVEPGLFQQHEGHPFYAAFAAPEDGRSPYLYYGTGAYERIPWYETSKATLALLTGFFGLFLLGSAVFGLKVRRLETALRPARRTAAAALAVAVMGLLFPAGFGAALALTDVQSLFHGWPWSVKALLALPLAAVVPLLVLGRGLGDPSARQALGPVATALGAIVLAGGVAFLAWLHVWNLLGWRL